MSKYFVQLKLGNKSFKEQVSVNECIYVAHFKYAIKAKFPNLLNKYDAAQLILFKPDGITEIDSQVPVTDLKEIPWQPMVVTVDEPTPIGSSKKQMSYKKIGTEASCRKYLDALAVEIYFEFYEFPTIYNKPTIGDVLAARYGQFGKPEGEKSKGCVAWWDYKKNDGIPVTNTPLPNLLSDQQWDILKLLNRGTTKRIHNGILPLTSSNKPYIVLPHSMFTQTKYVDALKSIATTVGLVDSEDELIVKDELGFSASSGSDSGSPT